MPLRPNVDARNAILDSGLDHWNGATLTIFNGTQPDAGGGAHSDDTLATITLPTPAFAAAASGGRGPASNWTGSVTTSGTAGWARLDAAGDIIDMAVGEGSGDLQLDDVTLVDGGTVSVTGGSITLPGNDA